MKAYLRALVSGGIPAVRRLRAQRSAGQADVAFFGVDPDAPIDLMRNPEFFTSDAYLRQQTRADWRCTSQEVRVFASALILEAKKRGIPLYAHCAYRTPDEQLELFRQGFSNNQGPDAPHVRGYAVDIVSADRHWELSRAEWAYLGNLGKLVAMRKGIKVEWGGDWKRPYDPAHWQIAGWDVKPLPPQSDVPYIATPTRLAARYK